MMKKQKQANRVRVSTARRGFRAGVLLTAALLAAGVVTAISRQQSGAAAAREASQATSGKNLVTVEVGGKKLQVDAQRLQQGPLSQDEAQQIADSLKDNKSTDGLVQIQHSDGSVEMDLQGRFQNVMIAKKNSDGSVATSCVDNPEAAQAFLSTNADKAESQPGRKVALQQQ